MYFYKCARNTEKQHTLFPTLSFCYCFRESCLRNYSELLCENRVVFREKFYGKIAKHRRIGPEHG